MKMFLLKMICLALKLCLKSDLNTFHIFKSALTIVYRQSHDHSNPPIKNTYTVQLDK